MGHDNHWHTSEHQDLVSSSTLGQYDLGPADLFTIGITLPGLFRSLIVSHRVVQVSPIFTRGADVYKPHIRVGAISASGYYYTLQYQELSC